MAHRWVTTAIPTEFLQVRRMNGQFLDARELGGDVDQRLLRHS